MVVNNEFSLDAKVFPNPSMADFNLEIAGNAGRSADIRILDMQGREFGKMKAIAGQRVRMGGQLKAGNYVIEVIQGNQSKKIRVLKF
jgi:hypothetical protein